MRSISVYIDYFFPPEAGKVLNRHLFKSSRTCDCLFRDPPMFIIGAFLLNEICSQLVTLSQRKAFNAFLAKLTTIVCFLWLILDLIKNGETEITAQTVPWIVDFLMVTILTIAVAQKFSIKKFVVNPIYPFLNIFCSTKETDQHENIRPVWIMTSIIECFLWLPLAWLWSENYCLTDGMINFKNPLGVFSMTMVCIMFLNLVPKISYWNPPIYHWIKRIFIIFLFYYTELAFPADGIANSLHLCQSFHSKI